MNRAAQHEFHHAAQNVVQLKTYELFIPGLFNSRNSISDHGQLQVTETFKKETMDKKGTTVLLIVCALTAHSLPWQTY